MEKTASFDSPSAVVTRSNRTRDCRAPRRLERSRKVAARIRRLGKANKAHHSDEDEPKHTLHCSLWTRLGNRVQFSRRLQAGLTSLVRRAILTQIAGRATC